MLLIKNTALVTLQSVVIYQGLPYKVVHVFNCISPAYVFRGSVITKAMKYASYCLEEKHWNLLVPGYDYLDILHLCYVFPTYI